MSVVQSLFAKTLDLLTKEANLYISGTNNRPIDLGNVAMLNDGNSFSTFPNGVILSLVNVEEDKMLKNPENFVRRNNQIFYKNPVQHFNLTLLFAAYNQENTPDNYKSALFNLEAVIRFFQQKSVFSAENTTGLDAGIDKVILDLVSLNIEQTHQLWSSLGGHYLPSVVFRMRLISIEEVQETLGTVIKEIQLYD
ncbi:DUF4255 domain-containing protein [Dyadobacter sp. NIV53]|uniref:DUF4255 domain-containing protein n=1 Tax=Dyadobacter sp. NIV53 TaxID=2861765 RepID=UPI001C870C9C|nr:DUF4255 domain-containing protein [Dyadobacter sp. NIV53]